MSYALWYEHTKCKLRSQCTHNKLAFSFACITVCGWIAMHSSRKNKIKGIIYDCIHTTYIVPDRWSNSWDCSYPARCASKSYASYEGPSQPALQPVDASSAPANSDIVIWQANNGDERPQGKGGLGRWPFFSFPLSRGQVNILSPCGLELPSWTTGMKDVCHRPDHAWVRGVSFPLCPAYE